MRVYSLYAGDIGSNVLAAIEMVRYLQFKDFRSR